MGTASIITVRQLKEHTDEIVSRVRDQGESIEVVDAGEIVAVITPASPRSAAEETAVILADLDRLAKEIGANWSEGVSAVDAVRDVRRDI